MKQDPGDNLKNKLEEMTAEQKKVINDNSIGGDNFEKENNAWTKEDEETLKNIIDSNNEITKELKELYKLKEKIAEQEKNKSQYANSETIKYSEQNDDKKTEKDVELEYKKIEEDIESRRQEELSNPNVSIDDYINSESRLTELGKKLARENKDNESEGKKKFSGMFQYLLGKKTAKEILANPKGTPDENEFGFSYHSYGGEISDKDYEQHIKGKLYPYKKLFDEINAKYDKELSELKETKIN